MSYRPVGPPFSASKQAGMALWQSGPSSNADISILIYPVCVKTGLNVYFHEFITRNKSDDKWNYI